MFNFVADPRDGYNYKNACSVCCCSEIHMKPGETNLLRVNYAGWVIPLMGRGLTINTWFDTNKVSADPASGGNQAVAVTPSNQATPIDTALASTVVPNASDPEAATLTWALLPLYGPSNGEVVLNADGTYTYTPHSMFEGVDTFFYEVSDGFNKTKGRVDIRVGNTPVSALPATAHVVVLSSRKAVDPAQHTMTVPIQVSADAVVHDIWRVNVRQEAIDCDGNKFYHTSCYDIIITKC